MAYGYETEEDVAPAYGVNPGDLPLRPPNRRQIPLSMPPPSPESVANQPRSGVDAQPIPPQMGQMAPAGDLGVVSSAGGSNPINQRIPPRAPMGAQEAALQKPDLHGWKNVLDVIGQIAAPRIEEAIPGSRGNYQRELGQARTADNQTAKLQEDQARLGQIQAGTERTNVETDLARNPKPKMVEIPGSAGPNGEVLFRDETGRTPGSFILGPNGYQPAPTGAGPPAGQAGPQLGTVTNQSPEKVRVPPDKVQSFAKDVKAGFPTLTDGQVSALVSELGTNPTQADMAKVQDRAEKYSQANQTASATAGQRDQVNADRQIALGLQQQTADQKKADKSNTVGWAFDQKTNQKVLTDQGTAEAGGMTLFQKTNPKDVETDEAALRQMNDIQLNVSRYKQAMDAIPGAIPADHVGAMTRILTDKDLNGALVNGATFGVLVDQINQGEKARAWNILTPEERNAVTGYLRAKGAVLAYQKALTGVGRTNKEQMVIEMANLPEPVVGSTVANPRFDAFQENIDTAAQGFGQIPWMEQPKDVRGRIEKPQAGTTGGASQSEPARPANVPAGYKWNANGPKGAGWYR